MTLFIAMETTLQGIPILCSIMDEDATAIELLHLVACIVVVWAVFFFVFCKAIHPLIKGKDWLEAAGRRDYARGGKEMYDALGCPKTEDEFVESFSRQWPWLQGVLIQHLVGGILCLPAIFHWGSPNLQSSLACLSILSEMGWEVGDLIGWIYQRWFTKGGKVRVPLGMIVLLAVHHSLTTIIGLPMVLRYRNLSTLHWLTFELQGAGATSLFVTEYTKLLDVSKPNQLRQFQVLTGFALVVMLITRLFHWLYLCGQLMVVWYNDSAWTYLAVGGVLSVTFSGFNYFFCLEPFCKRFVKFMNMSAEYEKIAKMGDAKTRRSSLIMLEQAAGNMMVHHDDLNHELAKLFQSRNDKVKKDRRDTMPASMFGSSGSVPSDRRVSTVLLRASMGDVSTALNQLRFAADLVELEEIDESTEGKKSK